MRACSLHTPLTFFGIKNPQAAERHGYKKVMEKNVSNPYCPWCMSLISGDGSCSVCGSAPESYNPLPHHLPPGTVLSDRYLIGRVLGEGGFGITYTGLDLHLEIKVAIKEYYPITCAARNASASLQVTGFVGASSKNFETGKQKFLNEAQIMTKMEKNQVIVGARDFFEQNNTAYIVMEYIEGITLRELVRQRGGKIPSEELLPLLEPLFHGLSMMHGYGLIHRDISPDNLMLENGRIRLLDFGCAREASQGTETMTIALKQGFAPVEQYQQRGQGPWTDLYALCATIYFCLTGITPPQALDRIAGDELVPPGKLGIKLPKEQEKALLKGMRLQPKRRFSDAEELWEALSASIFKDSGELKMPAAEGKDMAKPEASEGKAASDSGVTGSVSGDAVKRRPYRFMKAGIAAACLAAAVGAVFCYFASEKEKIPLREQAKNESALMESADGTALFANASLFTSGDKDEFRRLLEDDSVTAIVMDDITFDLCEPVIINKPVLISKDCTCEAGMLTVSEEGFLQVDGCLDMARPCYLRLEGSGPRLLVKEGGNFYSKGLLWMDSEDCLVWEDYREGWDSLAHVLIFSEDVFDGDDVVSVTDMESLLQAAALGKPIRIDSDITLSEGVVVHSPVWISEGVTVHVRFREDGTPLGLGLQLFQGSVLVNNGTIDGIYMEDNTVALNYGNMTSNVPGGNGGASMELFGKSTLVNFGAVDACDISRFWEESLFLNLNMLNACDLYLTGGNMANYGSMTLSEGNGYFEMGSGSRLANYSGAVITVASGTNFFNKNRILNTGNILIESGGEYHNAVLENNGFFQAENGAVLIHSGGQGIYYGSGEYDMGTAGIKVFPTMYYGLPMHWEELVVTTGEELVRALEDPETDEVVITADITMDTGITVRKNLYIADGSSLTMEGNAALTDEGSLILLGNGAALRGSHITLHEDSQIYMTGDSVLHVKEGGRLALEGSLLWGWSGNIQMDGAELSLGDRSGFLFDTLSSMETENGKILVQDGSFFQSPSYFVIGLKGASITLTGENGGSCVLISTNTDLYDCTVNVNSGVFCNAAEDLTMHHCTVTVGEYGFLESTHGGSRLSLIGDSALEIWGSMIVAGWDKAAFTVQGSVDNYGDLTIYLPADFSETVNNQGNIFYSARGNANYKDVHGRDRLDLNMIAGNAPVSTD